MSTAHPVSVHRTTILPALLLTLALLLAILAPASAHGPDGLKGGAESEAPADSASDFPGLNGEGDYTSPQFGLDITWEPSWQVGDAEHPAVRHAIGGYWSNTVDSVEDVGDIVFLMDTDTESAVLSLAFSYLSPNISITDVLSYMQEPEYLSHNLFLSEDAEVLLVESSRTSVAILARDAAPNQDHLVYQMMVVDPGDDDFGFWIGLDIYGLDVTEDIFRSVEEDVWVEDNQIFSVFDVDEMLAAISEETPTTTAAGGAGLVSIWRYSSQVHTLPTRGPCEWIIPWPVESATPPVAMPFPPGKTPPGSQ